MLSAIAKLSVVLMLMQSVSATFQEISLQSHASCGYDSVTLYDGSSDSSPQLGKVCTVARATIISTGHSLFVVFRSDHSVHTGRFSLSWTFVGQGGYHYSHISTNSVDIFCSRTSNGHREATVVPWAFLKVFLD